MLKVISFNINSVRARIHQVEEIINFHDPDVIGLQETKVEDNLFPKKPFEDKGYSIFFHGQKRVIPLLLLLLLFRF